MSLVYDVSCTLRAISEVSVSTVGMGYLQPFFFMPGIGIGIGFDAPFFTPLPIFFPPV
jgi:hypothetical protein